MAIQFLQYFFYQKDLPFPAELQWYLLEIRQPNVWSLFGFLFLLSLLLCLASGQHHPALTTVALWKVLISMDICFPLLFFKIYFGCFKSCVFLYELYNHLFNMPHLYLGIYWNLVLHWIYRSIWELVILILSWIFNSWTWPFSSFT